jgi:hypothetical protein
MQEVIRIGKCIYCGTSDGKLSDEHAIPYGLSGDLVLHEASCQKHADITSVIELRCLRGLLGRARAKLNLRTRRPKLVTTFFKFNHGFGWNKTAVDAKEFAGINPLPVFDPPAFLRGQRIDGGIKIRALDTLNLGSPIPNLPGIVKGRKLSYKFEAKLDVWVFARMIAKIGYCCAIAHLGLEKISETYILPSILGDSNDVQTWVGTEDILFNRTASLHEVTVFVREGTIFAHVCLFAAFGGKPYTVVVGKYKQSGN